MLNLRPLFLASAAICTLPAVAIAQDVPEENDKAIAVELNSTAQSDESCQLTFLMTNNLDQDATALVLETVLLTKDGAVNRLSLFDMRDLPAGAPRVRQFNVPALDCDDLGKVLINGVAECALDGSSTCGDILDLSSRIDVEILG